jgi:DNA replication protein DnaD
MIIKQHPGRPENPKALYRTAKNYLFMLSKVDGEKLRLMAEAEQITMSEVVRRLIREAFNG